MNTAIKIGDTKSYLSPPNVLLGKETPNELFRVSEEMSADVGLDGFIKGCTSAMNRPDSRATLSSLSSRTKLKILVGQDDSITPLAASKEMHKLVTHSTLKVYKGAGHLLPLEKSDEVCEDVIDFLLS
jgi:pimeloyl-ACP methyl ester carboxylesterase